MINNIEAFLKDKELFEKYYVKIKNSDILKFYEKGYIPVYVDKENGFSYFYKTEGILKIMRGGENGEIKV